MRAVNGVSFEAHRGETLALLGESGCGKSMTATALVGLLEPVAEVTAGSAVLAGTDLFTADKKKRRELAGTELAIVFQDALTALNPLYTVGTQLAEPFRIHHGHEGQGGQAQGGGTDGARRYPRARDPAELLPAPVLRRHAAAPADRHGGGAESPAC